MQAIPTEEKTTVKQCTGSRWRAQVRLKKPYQSERLTARERAIKGRMEDARVGMRHVGQDIWEQTGLPTVARSEGGDEGLNIPQTSSAVVQFRMLPFYYEHCSTSRQDQARRVSDGWCGRGSLRGISMQGPPSRSKVPFQDDDVLVTAIFSNESTNTPRARQKRQNVNVVRSTECASCASRS